ncbi:hypothetical protein GQ43DRAFT_409630 [Delitschia confertaspora ATCC 74209]|uniref:SNF2 family N-terminal domain protein n=1 Tax=Delitschia confertaspora ATCC 74209 TaxID=1513339 RepID=A0A9P4JRI5_9PLEO|nr:hypothetical protein GQ43DRAFT_409630 [Delitschia confertaspora ATCC 74209]
MEPPPRLKLASPLPRTPTKRTSGFTANLLQQFGAQSSPTSATKAKKASSQASPSKCSAVTPLNLSQVSPTKTTAETASNHWQASPMKTIRGTSSDLSPTKLMAAEPASAKWELRRRTPISYTTAPLSNYASASPKGREGPRRSTRQHAILMSDTLGMEEKVVRMSSAKQPRRKLNTARTRLREEIAAQTVPKMNAFLLANKDYFLPLLPSSNYITRLLSKQNGDAQPAVEYVDLSEQPHGVRATMKPYQISGLSFLVHLYNNGMSGILGDEMGLGKTLQTLSLFQYLEEQDQKSGSPSEELRPYLVVCPLSVLSSWVNEARKWVPDMNVLRFHGTTNERNHIKKIAYNLEDQYGNETNKAKMRKTRKAGLEGSKLPLDSTGAKPFKIVVTTYETFQAEQSWFKHAFVWRYIVLDEGHKIKNSVTQISKALQTLNAEFRLVLTGTPLQNNLAEMWSLLHWLYPDVFAPSTEQLFKKSFDIGLGKVDRTVMDNCRRLLELIMLRRMKDSPGVNLGLPPKEEVLLYVPLTPLQRFWYTRLLTRVGTDMLEDLFTDARHKEKEELSKERQQGQMLASVGKCGEFNWGETTEIMKQVLEQEQSNASSKTAWQKLMNLIMQLRKCCSHPYLLPGAAPEPYYFGDHIIKAAGKFIVLEKLLRHIVLDQGKRVLIFSGFTQTLDYCQDLIHLISDSGRAFRCLRLDGSTVRARRNLDIRMFNDLTTDYKVMLLSTRTGGLGINLTSASDVIFMDEDWNPQVTLQAEARAHRIGQTKEVTIYKLCTQGTVEEQILSRIRKKLYLSTKITESMRSVHGQGKSANGAATINEDMPDLGTTQLKSLVRRGAQTLSHPELDINEMLSWDYTTMLEKCRDKPADASGDPNAEVDEEKWLSTMEKVECAVWDGKRYHREGDSSATEVAQNVLPDEITRADRRKDKNTTVMVDGFAVNKESLACTDWEAVPTMAGKDPRLADVKREKRRKIEHEEMCHVCFDEGDLIPCTGCPRAYHMKCLSKHYQTKAKSWNGLYCPQHECFDCTKKATDAGGMIFRCRWCEKAYCEDCLDWNKVELVGDNLPEFEIMDEPPNGAAHYIKCPPCIDLYAEDEDLNKWVTEMEISYAEQCEEYTTQMQQSRKTFADEQERIAAEKEAAGKENVSGNDVLAIESDEGEAPPSLTDTSLPTATHSARSTPGPTTDVTLPLPQATVAVTPRKRKNDEGTGKSVLAKKKHRRHEGFGIERSG